MLCYCLSQVAALFFVVYLNNSGKYFFIILVCIMPWYFYWHLHLLPFSSSRLESDYLWVASSEGQGSIRHDPSHSASAPLPVLRLLLWSGGGVGCRHVISRLIHSLGQLHVCQEHLSARLSAVGKSANINNAHLHRLSQWLQASVKSSINQF